MLPSQEFTGPCNALNDTALSCEAPTLPDDNSTIQLVRLGLVMDGVTQLRSLNETIQVYRDPVFLPLTKDNSSLVFELREYDVITINVSLLAVHVGFMKSKCVPNAHIALCGATAYYVPT